MSCGIYGKLPAKRDFVARGAPRFFLDKWEPWLHGAISASRLELGEHWEERFLSAPAWRFWLGADICGTTVAGALAASYDGVGRYFPLTAFAIAPSGATFLPPPLNPQEGWFDAAEDWIYAARAQGEDFDRMAEEMEAMPPPTVVPLPAEPVPVVRLGQNTILIDASEMDMTDALLAIGVEARERAYRGRSIWWTLGNESVGQSLIVADRLLDPNRFTGLLTGEFLAMA